MAHEVALADRGECGIGGGVGRLRTTSGKVGETDAELVVVPVEKNGDAAEECLEEVAGHGFGARGNLGCRVDVDDEGVSAPLGEVQGEPRFSGIGTGGGGGAQGRWFDPEFGGRGERSGALSVGGGTVEVECSRHEA